MYLLDTDVLIWVLRGKIEIVDKISLIKKNHSLAISVVSIAEIYKNIFPAELRDTEAMINQHILIDVTVPIAKDAGMYWQQYAKKFEKFSLADCLIAASAKSETAKLLTLNTKHYPMHDIEVVSPTTLS